MFDLRRIDNVKNKKMKNIKSILILDKKRIKITFNNNQEIILRSSVEDYGYDSAIYIEQDNI
jgi:hypothetical protein